MKTTKKTNRTIEDISLFDVQFRDFLRDEDRALLCPVNPHVVKSVLQIMVDTVNNPLQKLIYEEAIETCDERIAEGKNMPEPENLVIGKFFDKETRFNLLQEFINENKNEVLSPLSIHRVLRNAPTKMFLEITKELPYNQKIEVGKANEYLFNFALRKGLNTLVARCLDNMSLEQMKDFLTENKKDGDWGKLNVYNFYESFGACENKDNFCKFFEKFHSILDDEDHIRIMRKKSAKLTRNFELAKERVEGGFGMTSDYIDKKTIELAEKYRPFIPNNVYNAVSKESPNNYIRHLDFMKELNAFNKCVENEVERIGGKKKNKV